MLIGKREFRVAFSTAARDRLLIFNKNARGQPTYKN